MLAIVEPMTTNTATIIAKIGNKLIEAGCPKETAGRLACTMAIKELTSRGVDLAEAYDVVFGEGHWEAMKAKVMASI